MTGVTNLRLGTSAAVKERRLLALLGGRDPADPGLDQALVRAQAQGSLELAGLAGTPQEEAERAALVRAARAVDPRLPLGPEALLGWQHALTGERGFRTRERSRDQGPPPAPAEFIASRLAIAGEWLAADSARELSPPQQGALVLARVMEIVPFERANARVARLAASHQMVRAGARPPILTGADAARWEEALPAAFRFHTEPLARLLEEASARALDVLIAALERGR